jgi:hypothetical protein
MATPPGTEQRVFVYSLEKSGPVFHDVWRSHVAPSDKTSAVKWVKKLFSVVPDDFAERLAETVAFGR